MSSPTFLRALMTAVCKAAIIGKWYFWRQHLKIPPMSTADDTGQSLCCLYRRHCKAQFLCQTNAVSADSAWRSWAAGADSCSACSGPSSQSRCGPSAPQVSRTAGPAPQVVCRVWLFLSFPPPAFKGSTAFHSRVKVNNLNILVQCRWRANLKRKATLCKFMYEERKYQLFLLFYVDLIRQYYWMFMNYIDRQDSDW